MSASEFFFRYGVLLGCGAVALALLWLGATIVSAIYAAKASLDVLAEKIEAASGSLKEELEQLNETVDSIHSVFGGRQWRSDDEFEKVANGPTIQRLLKSIDTRLKRLIPENGTASQTSLILPPKTPRPER